MIRKLLASVVLSLTIMVGATNTMAFAAGTKTDTATASYGAGSVQGYAADTALQDGTIVQLSGKDANKIAASTQADLGHMYGVTVDAHTISVTLSTATTGNQVYVATSGTYNVLVSTQGGTIKAGDYVTLSSIDGVAMLAGTKEKTVFGRAAGNFDGKSASLGTTDLKDTTGKKNQTVNLGIIPVTIDVKSNPNDKSTKANVPKVLQRLGEAIAEKPVGPLRMYLSIAITGISIMAAIIILYSGVRNSIISIGRNPLSRKSVFRALLEIILTSIIILIIGLFAVYLLLKL